MLRALTPLPSTIQSDPTRISQILINLSDNALKFTEKGRVTVEIEFHPPTLRFRVTDTGVGISEENQTKLFAPFSQGDASITRRFGGTGLGLVLTRRLCQLLGGQLVLVRSHANEGSVFEATIQVTIPPTATYLPHERLLRTQPTHAAPLRGSLSGLRILVVEDQPDNQTLLRILLREEGAHVTIVGDGEEGIKEALSKEYDAVLMDIQMPRMDGHTAARTLRAKGYSVPIVALTAHAMKGDREQALSSGFAGFLSKPLSREALVRTLSEVTSTGNTVLVVDDDDDLRAMITEVLHGEAAHVLSAATAEEALARVDTTKGVLVIITDLSLPGMSGEEFIKVLAGRADRQRMHVLLASGWDDLAKRAKDLGAEGYLRKPFDLTAVLDAVSKFQRVPPAVPSSRPY